MKILVTGAKGQLGSQLCRMIKEGASELGPISPEYKDAELTGIDLEDLDITDIESVKAYMNKLRPDLVINPAAYTNVNGCEEHMDIAFKANSIGARNMAIACEEIGAKLIHISTDYVFEGKGTVPYREFDLPNPVSVYGKTKLLGENYIKNFCSRYFIVRTAWLYGYNGKNFVYTIMNAAKKNGSLTVVNDQRGNPTNAEDLCYHILKLGLTKEYGIYHCTGSGECCWYDFASRIVEYSKINCTVSPVTSDEYERAAKSTTAKRPSFSSLDNMMLRVTVGDEMRNWEDALKCFINNI